MLNHFPQQSIQSLIPAEHGQLEVIIDPVADLKAEAYPLSIICHPHPLHGGTMHNKVVTTTAKAFHRCNISTIRFNYRGVGQSSGEFGHYSGEITDLLSIIAWIKKVLPETNLALSLAGFSFGCYVAASVANQMADITALLTIAPAVHNANFNEFLQVNCPWWVVQGEQDEVVPTEQVIDWAQAFPTVTELKMIPEAGHFFHGKLLLLRQIIEQWIN